MFAGPFLQNGPLVKRSTDALLAGVYALALLAVVGCGGSSQNSNQPLDPGTVTISAPTSGAKVTVLPVTITLNLFNGATLSSTKVTLDGADITSAFVSGANNTATATITSGVYIGSNRIQVTLPSQTVGSQFSYDPSSADTPSPAPPGSGSSTTLADTIPIQTRVQMNNGKGQQGWGIQVGQTGYPEPNGYTGGFQVVQLNRANLTLVSNTSYQVVNQQSAIAFSVAISSGSAQSACGTAGCLEIIQSLNTIGSACASLSCSFVQNALMGIGGTATIGNASDYANLAYSFIGNVGSLPLHPGSNFERITCASSDGCIDTYTPNASQVLYGIAPNGADGVLPTLKNTGSSGTTSLPATAYMPAMKVSNNGAMAGELVLDNTNNYTFAYADPQIHFYLGVEPNFPNKNLLTLDLPPQSQMTFPNGSHSEAAASAELPPNDDGSPVGGFRLAVFDAVTFQNVLNSTYTVKPFPKSCPVVAGTNYCKGPDGTDIYNLLQLQGDIQAWNSPEYILFLASVGNLDHDYPWSSNSFGKYDTQDVWDKVAQSVQDIGGTYATFVSLNNKSFAQDNYDQYLKNTWPHNDDYALVGQWWLNQSTVPNPYAMEESMQIARQTEANPVVSDVEGILEKQNNGYYQATLHSKYGGLMPAAAVALTTVPLQPPTSWPLTGPNGSAGQIAAYQWISQQLLLCVNLTGCNDIRSAYTNLNLDPAIWLATLADLGAPADNGSGFSATDFATAKAQLAIEFQYLGYLRQYQNNVLTLLQAEQSNASLILQQELDQISGNINFFSGTSSYGYQDWRTDVTDALNVVGAASGFIGLAATPESGGTSTAAVAGIQTAIGLTDMGLSLSAKNTNDPYGRSLKELEHEQIAGSQLAQTQVDEFAQILLSVGKDFDRIASDWGRLQAIGVPLANNAIPWDAGATGALLNSFDIATRRGFLRTLMPAGFIVTHYRYASPGVNNTDTSYRPGETDCSYADFMAKQAEGNPTDPNTYQSYASYAYIPGAPIDGLAYPIADTENTWPVDLWWDVWTMTESTPHCTNTSDMPQNQLFLNTGIFAPLDPANPNQLGMYKVWFYQRTFGQSQLNLIQTPNDANSYWTNLHLNLHMGNQPAAPDPVNY